MKPEKAGGSGPDGHENGSDQGTALHISSPTKKQVMNTATPLARRVLLEFSGACGDLGTFIPHVIGAMTIAGLAPAGVLFGFATFLIATGMFYGLPLPVQPMKAISAVIPTGGLGRSRSSPPA
jgi:hypothetical protein